MRSASTYVRELCAITEVVRKWRHYLLGQEFVIRTDHKSLQNLLLQPIHTPEQEKWLCKLMGYQYHIVYKPRTNNVVADALSRSTEPAVNILSTPTIPLVTRIREAQRDDPSTRTLIKNIQATPSHYPDFTITNDVLYFRSRFYLPAESPLCREMFEELHSTPQGGHAGFRKTWYRVVQSFFWRTLRKDIKTCVRECMICQQTKYTTTSPAGLLQPLPVPDRVWDNITMDFIVGLPPSNGKTTIYVVVDRLSKYAHFTPLSTSFTAKSVAS